MALASSYLSDILFERLVAFKLLGDKHEAGDAVVLDSNGSHLQHYLAQDKPVFFKAMSPHTVVTVSGAPSALSCNGRYTQVCERLYVQNVVVSVNDYAPQPRIIEFDGTRWCFKHRFAQGVACSLLLDQKENLDLVGVRNWLAFCGWQDGPSRDVHQIFQLSIVSVDSVMLDSEEAFQFNFGKGGHTLRRERCKPLSILRPQKLHTDGQVDWDPKEFSSQGNIELGTEPIFTPQAFKESLDRTVEQRLQGISHLPGPLASAFDGPLGALFCLMFGTCLGFSNCNMDIPIGACLLFSFVFPHKGALYDYINRRLHLYILNRNFSRIPVGNVEQRLRVLACSQQRREAHGSTDFYDLTLLDNLSTFQIFDTLDNTDVIRPFPLDYTKIVYGDDWIYAGDINLQHEPNGYGRKLHGSELTEEGYFKNGRFKGNCMVTDDRIMAARHVNTVYMSLQSLSRGADLASDDSIALQNAVSNAAEKLQSLYMHVDENVFPDIVRLLQGVNSHHNSRFKYHLIQRFERCIELLASVTSGGVDDNLVVGMPSSDSISGQGADVVYAQGAVGKQVKKMLRAVQSGHAAFDRNGKDQPGGYGEMVQGGAQMVAKKAKSGHAVEAEVIDENMIHVDEIVDDKEETGEGNYDIVDISDPSGLGLGFEEAVQTFGLINPANRCPYNSLVQVWFYLNVLRESVLASAHSHPTFLSLKEVFQNLRTAEAPSFMHSFAQKVLGEDMQHDIIEILDKVMLSFDSTILSQILDGMECNMQIYSNSKSNTMHITEVSSSFHCLRLTITGHSSIEEAIAAYLIDEAVIEYNYQDKDNSQVIKDSDGLTKRICFKSLPSVLHVQMKRMSYITNITKNCDKCEFSESLYLSENLASISYKLHSVVVHTGWSKRNTGHYYAYIKIKDVWWKFDDRLVQIATSNQAIEDNFGGRLKQVGRATRNTADLQYTVDLQQPTAYLLIYVRDTQPSSTAGMHSDSALPMQYARVTFPVVTTSSSSALSATSSSSSSSSSSQAAAPVINSFGNDQHVIEGDVIEDDLFAQSSSHVLQLVTQLGDPPYDLALRNADPVLPRLTRLLREPLNKVLEKGADQGACVDRSAVGAVPSVPVPQIAAGFHACVLLPLPQLPVADFKFHKSSGPSRDAVHNGDSKAATTAKLGTDLQGTASQPSLSEVHDLGGSRIDIPKTFTFSGCVALSTEHVERLKEDKDACMSKVPKSIVEVLQCESKLKNRHELFLNPDVRYDDARPFDCVDSTRVPAVQHEHVFVQLESVNWFFMALTTLFPDVMFLSSRVLIFRSVVNAQRRQAWMNNFNCHRPRLVLHPVNLPAHPSQLPRAPTTNKRGVITDEGNPGFHWVLGVLVPTWAGKQLTKLTIHVMDPYNNKCSYVDPTIQWYEEIVFVFFGIAPAFAPHDSDPNLKIQRGDNNCHCGVYIMALGLNFVVETLKTMSQRLVVDEQDTCQVGVELRKLVAWDCTRDPPILDACLLMSPRFSPIQPHTSVVSSSGHQCHQWWKRMPYHNLADCILLELQSGGPFSEMHKNKRGAFVATFQKDCYEPWDIEQVGRPLFYSSDKYFVKVYCIGIMGFFQKDAKSVNRAARAFQDATFTSVVCQKMGWWFKTFGLICGGLSSPCVFVCIARTKLARHELPDRAVGTFSYDLTEITGALHNDVYSGNIGHNETTKMYEAFDFERSALIDVKKPRPPLVFHQLYASSVAQKKQPAVVATLMKKVTESGLDDTRNFFRGLYLKNHFLDTFDPLGCLTCPQISWKYDGIFHLLQLLYDAAMAWDDPLPELVSKDSKECIVCYIRPFLEDQVQTPAVCNVVFERMEDGKIMVDSASFSDSTLNWQQLELFIDHFRHGLIFENKHELSSEAKTTLFFNSALSMEPFDHSVCSSSDEDGQGPSKTKAAPLKQIKGTKKTKLQPETTEERLDRDLTFISGPHGAPKQEILDTVLRSVKQRFPQYVVRAKHLKAQREQFTNHGMILDPTHFGSKVVLVSDEASQSRCINFIKSENELSLDTETAYPHLDSTKPSLFQIGTNRVVCLIQVSAIENPVQFYSNLRSALASKTLVHWGGHDAQDLKELIGTFQATFCDLQQCYTPPKSSLVGLSTCMKEFLSSAYELNKDWTLSGWDVFPLTDGQVLYSVLDVVSCHALHLQNFYKKSLFILNPIGTVLYHRFCDFSGKSAACHGLSFTETELCHYEDGDILQGFCLTSKIVSPVGFKPFIGSIRFESSPVDSFCKMLNSTYFCCGICSRLNWLKQIGHRCPKFLPDRQTDTMRNERSFGVHVSSVTYKKLIKFKGTDEPLKDALFCLSMLGDFFDMLPVDNMNNDQLINSVHVDCHHGYISYTLGFLARR